MCKDRAKHRQQQQQQQVAASPVLLAAARRPRVRLLCRAPTAGRDACSAEPAHAQVEMRVMRCAYAGRGGGWGGSQRVRWGRGMTCVMKSMQALSTRRHAAGPMCRLLLCCRQASLHPGCNLDRSALHPSHSILHSPCCMLHMTSSADHGRPAGSGGGSGNGNGNGNGAPALRA